MGARTTFTFITEPDRTLILYSHWGGESKAHDLANAIAKAKPRWSDETYALRIMVSQLIGESWDSETGYGLWTDNIFEEEYDPVFINLENRSVIYRGKSYDFSEFVEAYGA